MTPLRTLLLLAWPVVLARSSQAVVGFTDALMTASLGEDQLAAVTTGAVNIFSAAILPMGAVFIVQSFASQLKGRGDLAAARRYAWYGLIVAGATQVVAFAAIPAVPTLLGLFDYTDGVRAHMADYLEIRLVGVGLMIAVEVLGNWYGGLGNTYLHMVAGVTAMVVNVFLNWVLIFGNLGAPAMGPRGAAWASVIATAVGAGILALVFGKRWFVGDVGPEALRLRRREFWRLLRFGIPNGMNWFLEFAAVALFINVVVAHLGTSALAALMVVFNVNSVSFMPAFGIASSGAILVGQAIGSGRADEVPGLVKLTAKVTAVWQGSVGLLYLAIPGVLMQAFAPPGDGSSDLVALGTTMLAISAGWQLFDALAMTLGEALRAAGDTTWTLLARLLLAWFLFVPASALSVLVLGGGHVAAMLCLVVYVAAVAGLFLWRFLGGAWRDIDLTGEPEIV